MTYGRQRARAGLVVSALMLLGAVACTSSPNPNAACVDGQLAAFVPSGQAGSTGGNVIQAISIKNTSTHACVVTGYAQVVAVGTEVGSNGTRLALPAPLTTLVRQGNVATKPDPGARSIHLPASSAAVFYVESGAAGGSGESPFVITQLNITVPGTHRALDVAIPYPGLAASAPSDQPLDMTITAIAAN